MLAEPEPAGPTDAPALLALRDAAARWQETRGIQQWVPGEVTLDQLVHQVEDGEWHVLRCGPTSQLTAAVRLLDDDPDVWGLTTGPSLFVHGLVVDRARAGHGLGALLLAWAERRGRDMGRDWLRLDCAAGNQSLRDYYRRLGYTVVGSRSFTNGWRPVVLLEKSLRSEG